MRFNLFCLLCAAQDSMIFICRTNMPKGVDDPADLADFAAEARKLETAQAKVCAQLRDTHAGSFTTRSRVDSRRTAASKREWVLALPPTLVLGCPLQCKR